MIYSINSIDIFDIFYLNSLTTIFTLLNKSDIFRRDSLIELRMFSSLYSGVS